MNQENPSKQTPAFGPAGPEAYLRQLRGAFPREALPIEQLYIELEASEGGRLEDALAHPRRAILGPPGCGKTTFLRRTASRLADQWLGAAERPKDFGQGALPVFVSIVRWMEYIRATQAKKIPGGQTTIRGAGWLPHYLAIQSVSHGWGLDADWFRERLRQGRCRLLFDGLDEVPGRRERELAAQLLEGVAIVWEKTPIVVTSRPSGYKGRSVLPSFEPVHVEPLSGRAVETFFDRLGAFMYPTEPKEAADHSWDSLSSLKSSTEIRRLARNPAMLAILAVEHRGEDWSEKRLPERRAELYESILLWLARSREQRPGHAGPKRSLEVLGALALAMKIHGKGRHAQVTRHWAAEQVAGLFQGNIAQAEAFLEEEELDSGIIVREENGLRNGLRFWHPCFQEYLATRAIGGLSEEKQKEILLGGKRALCDPKWEGVGHLLGSVLYEQGREKVDDLVRTVLDSLYQDGEPPLADQQRVASLFLGIVRDLVPFEYAPADPRYPKTMEAGLQPDPGFWETLKSASASASNEDEKEGFDAPSP